MWTKGAFFDRLDKNYFYKASTNRKLHQNKSGEQIQAHFKMSGEPIEQKTSLNA